MKRRNGMIKDIFKQSLKQLLTNRYLTVLSIFIVVLAVALSIYIFVAVRPSELQLVSHYSAFGLTHFYRNQWFYLYLFAGFGIVTALLTIATATKLYITKGHPLAVLVGWLGVGIIIFAWATAVKVINVW